MQSLDASMVRRWLLRAEAELASQCSELNAANVFPVADGDTGSNMLSTWRGGLAAVESVPEAAGAGDILAAMGSGALASAAGNSGLILSQLVSGLADGCPSGAAKLLPQGLVAGLGSGARRAYQAVAAPVEGTILTVALASAAAAADASPDDLNAIMRAARQASRQALAATPSQLPMLARAGVLDTGAQGWCIILEALAEVAGLDPLPAQVPVATGEVSVVAVHGSSAPESFEVMFSLRHDAGIPPAKAEELRDALATVGDSIVVAEPSGVASFVGVHVHTGDIGAAIEVALDFGRPTDIRVLTLPEAPGMAAPIIGKRVIIAAAYGPGAAALFESEGAFVIPGGVEDFPTEEDFFSAIEQSEAREVVILPGEGEVIEAAQRAAARARDLDLGRQIAVLPAKSTVQTLSALAVSDPTVVFGIDVIAMTTAVAMTRFGAVTIAESASITMAGMCEAGDVLGLLEGEVVTIGSSLTDVGLEMIERMLHAGGELVTVVLGEDCPGGLEDSLRVPIERKHPGIEWVSYDGGQALYPLLLGVE